MAHHLAKHAVHVILIVSALVTLQMADIEMSTVSLVVLLAVCLLAFEGGLWLLYRRDAERAGLEERPVAAPLRH
jgi:hypothetical protein